MKEEYNLNRFIDKQKIFFELALKEIENGRKKSHWMWFVFPQLKELGNSNIAKYYGILDLSEAKMYINNSYLRNNLITITQALLKLEVTSIQTVFDYPDDLKLCSCMTLFEVASPEVEEFKMVLKRFYNDKRDANTLNYLFKK